MKRQHYTYVASACARHIAMLLVIMCCRMSSPELALEKTELPINDSDNEEGDGTICVPLQLGIYKYHYSLYWQFSNLTHCPHITKSAIYRQANIILDYQMTLSDCKRYFQKLKGDSHYYFRWGGEIILQKDQDSDIVPL